MLIISLSDLIEVGYGIQRLISIWTRRKLISVSGVWMSEISGRKRRRKRSSPAAEIRPHLGVVQKPLQETWERQIWTCLWTWTLRGLPVKERKRCLWPQLSLGGLKKCEWISLGQFWWHLGDDWRWFGLMHCLLNGVGEDVLWVVKQFATVVVSPRRATLKVCWMTDMY